MKISLLTLVLSLMVGGLTAQSTDFALLLNGEPLTHHASPHPSPDSIRFPAKLLSMVPGIELPEGQNSWSLGELQDSLGLQADADSAQRRIQLYNYNVPDYGIYFFGKKDACQKYIPGIRNAFFDPKKPTVIYAHGLQSGSTSRKFRENFHFEFEETDVWTHHNWLKEGWNVAIFYWIQFADEPTPWEAEAKINSTLSKVGMHWRDGAGNAHEEDNPDTTIAALFADQYRIIFENKQYKGSEVRMVGNSLGGQLILQTGLELHRRGCKRMPDRFSLLDPAWSPQVLQAYPKYQDLSWTGHVSEEAGRILFEEYKIPIDYYRTSPLTTLTTPKELAKIAAFQHMKFDYTWSIPYKHTFSVQHYFWSKAFPAPPETGKGKGKGLSASTSNDYVLKQMNRKRHWKHKEGTYTPNPEDDQFKRKRSWK